MYQNVTLIPLSSPNGEVEHVGIMIYDMTAAAMSQQALREVNAELARLSRTDKLNGLANRGYWRSACARSMNAFAAPRCPPAW